MRVLQVLVGAAPGDAVTGAAVEIQALLATQCVPSEIYSWHIDPRLAGTVHPLATYERNGRSAGDDLVIFHVSIGQPEVCEWILGGTEQLVIYYHNISPASAFAHHDPAFAQLLAQGRSDLVLYQPRTQLALAASAYNAAELTAIGYRDVRVSPLVYDATRLTTVAPHGPTTRHLEETMDGPIVVSVGQMLPHKRPDYLLEAFFVLITYLIPEANLIVIGAQRLPPYTRALEQFMSELNLKRAWLTGHVSDEELAAFYRHADVYATASEHEGFCAPLLEAMAFDIPIVARDFAAVGETLGGAGVLVRPDDPPEVFAEALAAVIEGRSLANELIGRGAQRLGEFGAERARRTFLDHLRSVLPTLGAVGGLGAVGVPQMAPTNVPPVTGEEQGKEPGVAEHGVVPAIDLRAVLAEIDEEVKDKRSSGELPEDFERHLDRSFAKFAPVDAVTGDFPTLLSKLESSTTIDTRAPTASSRPGVAQVKAVVAKAIDWDLRHLASQMSGLTHAMTRALGLLGDRIDGLERDSSRSLDDALVELGGAGRAALPEGDWVSVCLEALTGVKGRVLHSECGAGELVASLRSEGLDIYGVDPVESALYDRAGPAASSDVADIRHDSTRSHLRLLPAASLGGLVLSGGVDRLAPAAVLELVDLARTRLSGGGRLVVISHHAQAWATRPANIAADLAAGHPLRPSTWEAILAGKGFAAVAVVDGPSGFAVSATR